MEDDVVRGSWEPPDPYHCPVCRAKGEVSGAVRFKGQPAPTCRTDGTEMVPSPSPSMRYTRGEVR